MKVKVAEVSLSSVSLFVHLLKMYCSLHYPTLACGVCFGSWNKQKTEQAVPVVSGVAIGASTMGPNSPSGHFGWQLDAAKMATRGMIPWEGGMDSNGDKRQ